LSNACIEIELGGAAATDAIAGFGVAATVHQVGIKRTVLTGEEMLESATAEGGRNFGATLKSSMQNSSAT
jgi:hypothetical protein